MDTIFIEKLEVEAILGIFAHERENPQPVVFDIEFAVDISAASRSEDIDDTVSYATVSERVCALTIDGRYQLVETLAQAVADMMLGEFGVPWARIKVSKPDAVEAAAAVGIVIERGQR